MAGSTLILGASSFVGGHLVRSLTDRPVLATYNARPFHGAVHFESTSMALSDIVSEPSEFAAAIILLGDTQPDSCFADPRRSNLLNVESLKAIIDQLVKWDIRPIFTSTEFVFDGEKGGYVEADITRPILLYGAQKLAIEGYLAKRAASYTILRLAKVYGETLGDGTLFTSWVEAVENGSSMRCAADQRFSPVFVGDVVAAIRVSLERRLEGLFHVAGPVAMSRTECLETLIAAFRRHRETDAEIIPCSIGEFDLPERRPLDVSLRADKLTAATGIEPRHPGESCDTIARAALASAHASSPSADKRGEGQF